METTEKDKFVINSIEPDTEEIIISYNFGWCPIILFIFISIIFLWCPVPFYILLIRQPYMNLIIIDKKKKTLTIGTKGVIHCSACCFFVEKVYDLNEVKNVKVQVTYKDDPKKGFGKLYYIESHIYSNNNECECLFSNIDYSKEKYDEYISFFKKYIITEEEPIECAKKSIILPNEDEIKTEEQNDIEIKPSINEDPAMPVIP